MADHTDHTDHTGDAGPSSCSGSGTPGGNRADIGGDAHGPVVVGAHNFVIGADHGSTVTVRMPENRPRPERRATVRLLPRRQGAPLGREAELAEIAAAVEAGRTVQWWGPPGIGKSALLRYAARALPPGRDGVLFLDADRREPEDLAQDMFEACYESSGYAPSSSELRRLMSGLELTVYVDNADYSAERLRTFMDAAPDATFVIASREGRLLGEDGRARRLAGLGRDAALELLARELGRHVVRDDEEETALALWTAAEGSPLPLLRAAVLARPHPSGEAVLPRPGAVAELLPPLLARLDGPLRRALHLLAVLDGADLDPGHLRVLDGAEDPGALYTALAGLGLAERTERGYRVVADVVPALERYGGPQPFSVEQLCRHFARWAGLATTAPAQVAAHTGVLERLGRLAEGAGRPDLAVQVARAASPGLARSLRFGVWGRLLDHGLSAARRAGDRRAEAYFTHEQGVRAILTGNRVAAGVLLAGAAHLWRELGDIQGAEAAQAAQRYAPEPASPADGPTTDPAPDHTPDTSTTTPTPADGGTTPTPDQASAQAGGPSTPDPASAHAGSPSAQDPTAAHASSGSGTDPASAYTGSPPGTDPASAYTGSPPGTDPASAHAGASPGPGPDPAAAHAGAPAGPDPASVHAVNAP
uniref:ATP-binding protein n=1 Tax=Streptomyces sp. CRN 30 TaxID=3075613 RepID=UPI002A8377FD